MKKLGKGDNNWGGDGRYFNSFYVGRGLNHIRNSLGKGGKKE